MVKKMSYSNGKPTPKPLSPSNKNSFAYPTMKDRVPVIICKVVDLLYRNRSEYNMKQPDDLKAVIEDMSKLRYELLTNKPLLPITDDSTDAKVWNEFLSFLKEESDDGQNATWFGARWLAVECFVYRRLLESLRKNSTELADYDFFEKQKRESFYGSLSAISSLLTTRDTFGTEKTADKSKLIGLIKISLWGNKCDLSISAGTSQSFHHNPMEQVNALESHLLVDHSEKVTEFLLDMKEGSIVDIVMDNAGFELVSDLCLADYLVSTGLVKKVRLRVKNQPWFVSDTMPHDIEWVLNEMCDGANKSLNGGDPDPILCKYGQKWKDFVKDSIWTIHSDAFWTYPHDFSMMKKENPSLYSQLSEANILIFKGDLNYRKLVGDLSWSTETTFLESLQGFNPAPLVALRTLKADVCVGLGDGQAEATATLDENFMVNGKTLHL